MRPLPLLLALLLLLGTAHAQRLTIAAASSLTEVMQDLATTFEARHDGVRIDLNLAGSATLATQIRQGAPFDVFASANEPQMNLVASDELLGGAAVPFAGNRLVVITPNGSPVTSVADLARDGALIVLAGPEVPVGAYAREVLVRLDAAYGDGYANAVLANVVSEEPNARQVAAKVTLGEADAAIVYATDAAILDPAMVTTLAIDDAYNVTARYPIAVLDATRHADLARAFVDFVLSDEGQALLAARGFTAP